jgi:hypothetical protein
MRTDVIPDEGIPLRNSYTGYIYAYVYSYKQAVDYMERAMLRVDQWFIPSSLSMSIPVIEVRSFERFCSGRTGLCPEVWARCTGLNLYVPNFPKNE